MTTMFVIQFIPITELINAFYILDDRKTQIKISTPSFNISLQTLVFDVYDLGERK